MEGQEAPICNQNMDKRGRWILQPVEMGTSSPLSLDCRATQSAGAALADLFTHLILASSNLNSN